jgi:peptidoglycan-N-acetylglucosamine deacetylase
MYKLFVGDFRFRAAAIGLCILALLTCAAAQTVRPAKPAIPSSAPKAVKSRGAFYVKWDSASFASLQQNHQQIGLLFPEWLHVTSADGRLRAADSSRQLFEVVNPADISRIDVEVMPFLKQKPGRTQVFPLVNNYNPVTKQWIDISRFLNDDAARRTFREQLLAFLRSGDYRGLVLDLEQIPREAQPDFQKLVAELGKELHRHNRKLFVAVPGGSADFNYKVLARHADTLILMLYDQHHEAGKPGPIAAQAIFERHLREAIRLVPRTKLMVALGNYGYDWTSADARVLAARSVTVPEAWKLAYHAGKSIELERDSLNPHVTFTDDSNQRHDLWFLDAVTAFNQMRAANRLGVDAFALWRLGAEDPSLWAVWSDARRRGAERGLVDVSLEPIADPQGDALMHVERPVPLGQRKLMLDPRRGLIIRQELTFSPD